VDLEVIPVLEADLVNGAAVAKVDMAEQEDLAEVI